MAVTIFPFTYQSAGISFAEWISLLTLCLAPLFAHVAAGAPPPSFLTPLRHYPKWHDRIIHFNPTSILWRYYAITDRRSRSRAWTPYQMAVANALFWTPTGWDGSETMVENGRKFCTQAPESRHVTLASWAAVK